jgi:hypothetical protein
MDGVVPGLNQLVNALQSHAAQSQECGIDGSNGSAHQHVRLVTSF